MFPEDKSENSLINRESFCLKSANLAKREKPGETWLFKFPCQAEFTALIKARSLLLRTLLTRIGYAAVPVLSKPQYPTAVHRAQSEVTVGTVPGTAVLY